MISIEKNTLDEFLKDIEEFKLALIDDLNKVVDNYYLKIYKKYSNEMTGLSAYDILVAIELIEATSLVKLRLCHLNEMEKQERIKIKWKNVEDV